MSINIIDLIDWYRLYIDDRLIDWPRGGLFQDLPVLAQLRVILARSLQKRFMVCRQSVEFENTDKTWLDFTRLSATEMTLSDMGLIDTSRITNYVKGFTHISFARFAYGREELLSIRTKTSLNSRFEENIIGLVR